MFTETLEWDESLLYEVMLTSPLLLMDFPSITLGIAGLLGGQAPARHNQFSIGWGNMWQVNKFHKFYAVWKMA